MTTTTLSLKTHSNGTTTVNDGTASIVTKDIYASNGVIHTVDSLLVPPGSPLFKATAEKWLLALNATVFVGMLREAGLSSYVDGSEGDKKWTILAPSDDVLVDLTTRWTQAKDLQKRSEGVSASQKGSIRNVLNSIREELRTLLRYHIIPGILETEDLVDGQLVGTELRPDSLRGERMRLKVDVVGSSKIHAMGNGDLAFGGANVIAEPGTLAFFAHV